MPLQAIDGKIGGSYATKNTVRLPPASSIGKISQTAVSHDVARSDAASKAMHKWLRMCSLHMNSTAGKLPCCALA